jgi:chromosome segregation ATPase
MSLDSPESRPEVQALTSHIGELESFAASYQVTTPEQYQAGAADLQKVKAAQKRLEETRTSLTRPINESLKRLNDFFRAPAERLVTIERQIKGRLIAYSEEQERRRRELQRQADEEARLAREKAQREAAAAREKADREAAELRAKAEAEAAAGRQAEAAKLTARAEAKIERAETKAETLQAAAAMTVAPVVQAEQTKVRGVVTREVWKFEVIDPAKVAPAMMVPDEAKIRRTVAALKGDAGPVVGPGVRVWRETSIAAGAA